MCDLRHELKARSLGETVRKLIDEYRNSFDERVAIILCYELIESKFSIPALVKILEKKGIKNISRAIQTAMKYLTKIEDEQYTVNPNKCKQTKKTTQQ